MIAKSLDIDTLNTQFRDKSPHEIIDWAIQQTDHRIVTTSFGKYSAVLLHTFFQKDPNINIIWCDTGFNTPETYKHALELMRLFQLNIHTYVPLQSRAYIEATLGIPQVQTLEHERFTEIVKLEPFKRAFNEHKPELWFTNIRERQTELRSSKDIFSVSKQGILKVSPYYYFKDHDLDAYLEKHNLSKNETYFDPIKALENRECGIHLQ
ncbi:MAG: phosphoadenosine phosphosulfate reductase family protein [Flavobacteriaceae bacterium]|nr:phosphoadenosine phosphosulfate reductase family protein [Flavobacteriaceae bacterium]